MVMRPPHAAGVAGRDRPRRLQEEREGVDYRKNPAYENRFFFNVGYFLKIAQSF